MLANATPVVGARAVSGFNAPRPQCRADTIGFIAGASAKGSQLVSLKHWLKDRTAAIVADASAVALLRGQAVDIGFGDRANLF